MKLLFLFTILTTMSSYSHAGQLCTIDPIKLKKNFTANGTIFWKKTLNPLRVLVVDGFCDLKSTSSISVNTKSMDGCFNYSVDQTHFEVMGPDFKLISFDLGQFEIFCFYQNRYVTKETGLDSLRNYFTIH